MSGTGEEHLDWLVLVGACMTAGGLFHLIRGVPPEDYWWTGGLVAVGLGIAGWGIRRNRRILAESHDVLDRVLHTAGESGDGPLVVEARHLTTVFAHDRRRKSRLLRWGLGSGVLLTAYVALTGQLPLAGVAILAALMGGVLLWARRHFEFLDRQEGLGRKHPDGRKLEMSEPGVEVGVGLLLPGAAAREAVAAERGSIRIAWHEIRVWRLQPPHVSRYHGELPARHKIGRSGGPTVEFFREAVRHREAEILARVQDAVGRDRLLLEAAVDPG